MPNQRESSTITVCQTYEVFKILEEAFGYFADVLAGLRCQELDCDVDIDVEPGINEILEWLREHRVQPGNGGGGTPCHTNPCIIDPRNFEDQVRGFAERTPQTALAVAALLQRASGKKIKFMTLPAKK